MTSEALMRVLDDPTNLGNILMFKLRAVNLDKVKEALLTQMSGQRDKRLGAVLVGLGLISSADLDLALSVQKLLRRGQAAEAAMLCMEYQLNRVATSEARVDVLADALLRGVG